MESNVRAQPKDGDVGEVNWDENSQKKKKNPNPEWEIRRTSYRFTHERKHFTVVGE